MGFDLCILNENRNSMTNPANQNPKYKVAYIPCLNPNKSCAQVVHKFEMFKFINFLLHIEDVFQTIFELLLD